MRIEELTVQDIQDAYLRLLKKRLKKNLPKLRSRLLECKHNLHMWRLGLDPELVKKAKHVELAIEDR